MPIYMDVLRLERLVVIVARGHVTAEQIAETTRSLIAANVPAFAKIIDVTGSASDLTREQVQRIADMFRGSQDGPSRGPVAFVVNPARQGFAEAFAEVTQGDRPIELFTSLHAARRWLKQAKEGATRPSATLHDGVPVRS
jgi:GT2 family glycosyltransferase